MVTYLSEFCPNLFEMNAPLKDFVQKNIPRKWRIIRSDATRKIKETVVGEKALKLFDPTEPITLSVDSPQSGMGAVILQNEQPIEYASCALTNTQKSYAQIEKEFMAIQYGLTRFHQYFYGQHITAETDHLPLLSIMRKGLNDLTLRLLRMRLRMQLYDFKLVYKPCKSLVLADMLSRACVDEPCSNAVDYAQLEFDQIHSVVTDILQKSSFKQRLVDATNFDKCMQILISYNVNGWPAKRNAVVQPLKPYWHARHELTVRNDLVLRNNQIVIPVAMRKTIMEDIHKGHLGIFKCIERAKNAVY